MDVNVKITDRQGLADYDPPVIVRNGNRPVVGILVYQVAGSDDTYLTVAVDPTGKHFPERLETCQMTAESGFKKSGLLTELVVALETVKALNYARRDAKRQEHFFIGADSNVNKYCVSLQQMVESNIVVPFGIIGVVSEEIESAAVKPLSWLFEKHVVKTFGRHSAYEVWVPKTMTNLCGEAYSELVCPINTRRLSEELWMHANVPVWEIKGPCTIGNTNRSGYRRKSG